MKTPETQSGGSLEPVGSEMRRYINRTPALISLLYDIDLLPEQVEEGTLDWRRMMILAAWWQQLNSALPNVKLTGREQPPAASPLKPN